MLDLSLPFFANKISLSIHVDQLSSFPASCSMFRTSTLLISARCGGPGARMTLSVLGVRGPSTIHVWYQRTTISRKLLLVPIYNRYKAINSFRRGDNQIWILGWLGTINIYVKQSLFHGYLCERSVVLWTVKSLVCIYIESPYVL